MNSYIFYVDILRRGKYNEGKYCAEYGNRLNTPERRCGKYRRLHSVCCRALLTCNWTAVISSIGGKASKSSFGVERGCGLYCGAGAESGFR